MPLLNQADVQSPTWAKIRRHMEERLADHRIENDSSRLSEVETARLRGRIAEALYVTALADPDPVIPAE